MQNLLYAFLSKNGASRIYALLLAKFAKVPGLGGGGSTQFWQLGAYGPPTHPLLVNHNVVTDWLKLDATDIRSWHEYAGVCQRSKHLLRTMDDHLVVHIVHLHLPFGQSVGAAAEPEFVCDQGQNLPVFVLFTSRASTQTHLDRITWQLNTHT